MVYTADYLGFLASICSSLRDVGLFLSQNFPKYPVAHVIFAPSSNLGYEKKNKLPQQQCVKLQIKNVGGKNVAGTYLVTAVMLYCLSWKCGILAFSNSSY